MKYIVYVITILLLFSGFQILQNKIEFNLPLTSITAGDWKRIPLKIKTLKAGIITFDALDISNLPKGVRLRLLPKSIKISSRGSKIAYLDIYTAEDLKANGFNIVIPYSVKFENANFGKLKSKSQHKIKVRKPKQISKIEIKAAFKTIAKSKSNVYAYAAFHSKFNSKGELGKAKLINSKMFNGQFLMRNKSNLNPLPKKIAKYLNQKNKLIEPYYTDEYGSIIFFGDLSRKGEVPLSYTGTIFSDGSTTIAFDGDHNGIADIILGGTNDPFSNRIKMWIAANELGDALWGCLIGGNQVNSALLNDLIAFANNRESGASPCGNYRGGAFGRSPGMGGGVGGTIPGINILGEPDCGNAKPGPIAQTTDEGAGDPNDGNDDEDDSPGSSQATANQPVPTPSQVARAFMDEIQDEARNREITGADSENNEAPGESSLVDRGREIVRKIENAEPIFVGRVPEASGTTFQAGVRIPFSSSQPPIGPDGKPNPSLEDPRCAGQLVDAERGSSFMNKRFCNGDDLITCLRKQEDPIFHITGGRCWTEMGPDGNSIMVCERNQETGIAQDPENENDDLIRPGTHGQRIDQDYISLTPIGGIMAVICQADCPGEIMNIRFK